MHVIRTALSYEISPRARMVHHRHQQLSTNAVLETSKTPLSGLYAATRLSVNVNKIATIRNARGGSLPCPIEAAQRLCDWGVEGITVHPRPDGRHITYDDVRRMRDLVGASGAEFNIEGYPSDTFMQLVAEVRPDQVTLVPDPPDVLTSNAGWDTVKNAGKLSEVLATLRAIRLRSSLFIGVEPGMIEGAAALGAKRIELYTEAYAAGFIKAARSAGAAQAAVAPYAEAAKRAAVLGLGVNAGHDLDLDNLAFFDENLPELLEVSIGHAFVSDALYLGMRETLARYQACLVGQSSTANPAPK